MLKTKIKKFFQLVSGVGYCTTQLVSEDRFIYSGVGYCATQWVSDSLCKSYEWDLFLN